MVSVACSARQHCNRALFRDLHKWWFSGVPNTYDAAVPEATVKMWFRPDSEIDAHCRDKYRAAVEEAVSMSVDEIKRIVETPEDAVAAVVLLDQMPRNIYRGDLAAKAYRDCDPKALSLAKTFLAKPYDLGDRSKFANFYGSCFLYMPFMHSEDLADHDTLLSLLASRKAHCTAEAERKALDQFVDIENQHRDALARFGRYPNRNRALGRQSTPEELEYLEKGGVVVNVNVQM